VRRRAFITLLGGAAAAWPLAARAQQPERMRRIGVLMGYAESDAAAQAQVAALRQELRKLGWEEGRNGNLTGFANWDSPAISGKWLELLKEVAPEVERVAFMIHPETPALVRYFKSAEALAPVLKVKLTALGVRDADEIERGLTALAAERNGGVIVGPHAVTLTNRDLIVALAARLRLPALYPLAFYAKAGGLISYGFDPVDQFQQGAGYVDRILRGAKPADLPVQYPTKLQLVVNLKTARALGLTVPPMLLGRADEVIE
jgi:putative tryptophan/tyrosine transport system substrate-binding protein